LPSKAVYQLQNFWGSGVFPVRAESFYMGQIIWLGQSLIIFLGPNSLCQALFLAAFWLLCFALAALIYSAQLNANAVVCAC